MTVNHYNRYDFIINVLFTNAAVSMCLLIYYYTSMLTIQLQQLGIDDQMYFIRRLCVGVRSLMANVWAFFYG